MEKEQKFKKYVVYTNRIGRTDKGVLFRFADIVGKVAFVRRELNSTTADVLPTVCVFDEKEKAQAYLANGGQLKWVFYGEQRRNYTAGHVFQAHITESIERHGYYSRTWIIKPVDPDIAKTLNKQFGCNGILTISYLGDTRFFETEGEAKKYAVENASIKLSELEKEAGKYSASIEIVRAEIAKWSGNQDRPQRSKTKKRIA